MGGKNPFLGIALIIGTLSFVLALVFFIMDVLPEASWRYQLPCLEGEELE